MKIVEVYKYSWFANLAYVDWNIINTGGPEERTDSGTPIDRAGKIWVLPVTRFR